MFIKNIQIENYKCFDKTEFIELTQGINLVLGKNNVGKTAFLEALAINVAAMPFRDINSDVKNSIDKTPKFSGEIEISFKEFIDFVLDHNGGSFKVPVPDNRIKDWKEQFENNINSDNSFFSLLFKKSNIALLQTTASFFDVQEARVHGLRHEGAVIKKFNENMIFEWMYVSDRQIEPFEFVFNKVKASIYRFKAERLNLSKSSMQVGIELRNDASNLAGALQELSSNQPSQYSMLCDLVRSIFPDIHRVVSKNTDGAGGCRIDTWQADPSTQRESAVISLSECGTGISQVLAILFIIITSKDSRIIIIDEPNSFLHPGAAKKLIEILKKYPQHQYIISTHSPEIIKTANAKNVIMLTRENGVTSIEKIDPDNIDDLKSALIDMGSSLSDVFGADTILWVEGKTEEECFKLIAESEENFPIDVSIVGVKHTGDFDSKSRKKDPKLIWAIYNKLSGSSFMLPPAVGFVFDRETRTKKDIADLERESDGLVSFLSRRMYENYLINSEAIVWLLNECDVVVNESDVTQWLIGNGGNKPYVSKIIDFESLDNIEWLKVVDGAKLLKDLFSNFSDEKESYSKTRDGLRLTKWFLNNKPEVFGEIVEIIRGVVSKG